MVGRCGDYYSVGIVVDRCVECIIVWLLGVVWEVYSVVGVLWCECLVWWVDVVCGV